uniref:Uncharacterized protein n=1 Tax=Panagrolaimus sp. ES5 TaxID=591445 RepID=A0AC34G745_9BILA
MLPKGFMKKFAKYVHKLLPSCLKTSSSQTTISYDAIDALEMQPNSPASQQCLELTEAEVMQYMDECEARKIAAHARVVATIAKDTLEQPCHSFDLIAVPSMEIYP